MSLQATNWVWDRSTSRGTDRLVALALADRADDGGACFPKIRELTRRTGVSASTVRRSLQALVDLGELSIERRTEAGGRQTTNLYRLRTDREGVNLKGGGCQLDRGEGVNGDRGEGVTAMTPPERSEGTVRRNDHPQPEAERVRRVFEEWRRIHRKASRTHLDAKRHKAIAAALKAYPEEDVLAAVGHTIVVEGRAYDELTLLLRDAAHIERARDAVRAQRAPADLEEPTPIDPALVPDPEGQAKIAALLDLVLRTTPPVSLVLPQAPKSPP